MNKTRMLQGLKALLILVIIVAVIYCTGWYEDQYNQYKQLTKRCAQEISFWRDFEWGLSDCYNNIIIRSIFQSNGYVIFDDKNQRQIAEINNMDQFKVVDTLIYLKNIKIGECKVFDGTKERFCQYLFNDGKETEYLYDKRSDIPTYLIVNTITGDTIAYKSIDEIPRIRSSIQE